MKRMYISTKLGGCSFVSPQECIPQRRDEILRVGARVEEISCLSVPQNGWYGRLDFAVDILQDIARQGEIWIQSKCVVSDACRAEFPPSTSVTDSAFGGRDDRANVARWRGI
jgi:hypothetical protein